MHKTILVEILEVDNNLYTKIIAQCQTTGKMYLFTVFPNWQGIIPVKGKIGYIEFEFVRSGISKYYDKAEQLTKVYKNTYYIFYTFIEKKVNTTKKVLKC